MDGVSGSCDPRRQVGQPQWQRVSSQLAGELERAQLNQETLVGGALLSEAVQAVENQQRRMGLQ